MKKLNIGIFKVLSLAVGLAVGLVLIAKISFESSYDRFYPEYENIYCIQQEYTKANEGSDTYGHPYSRTLGVAVNTSDGEGQFVVLQLNTAGNVDSDHLYPSTQVHTGFGPIADIAFI